MVLQNSPGAFELHDFMQFFVADTEPMKQNFPVHFFLKHTAKERLTTEASAANLAA